MELGGVRSIKGLDLVPRTPRIGDRSKPRLGHSAGFCLAAYDEIPALLPVRASHQIANIFAALANVSVLIEVGVVEKGLDAYEPHSLAAARA